MEKIDKNENFRNVKTPIRNPNTSLMKNIIGISLAYKNSNLSNFLQSDSYKWIEFCGRSLNSTIPLQVRWTKPSWKQAIRWKEPKLLHQLSSTRHFPPSPPLPPLLLLLWLLLVQSLVNRSLLWMLHKFKILMEPSRDLLSKVFVSLLLFTLFLLIYFHVNVE